MIIDSFKVASLLCDTSSDILHSILQQLTPCYRRSCEWGSTPLWLLLGDLGGTDRVIIRKEAKQSSNKRQREEGERKMKVHRDRRKKRIIMSEGTHPSQWLCTTRSISSGRQRWEQAASAGTCPLPAARSSWPGCWTGRRPQLIYRKSVGQKQQQPRASDQSVDVLYLEWL